MPLLAALGPQCAAMVVCGRHGSEPSAPNSNPLTSHPHESEYIYRDLRPSKFRRYSPLLPLRLPEENKVTLREAKPPIPEDPVQATLNLSQTCCSRAWTNCNLNNPINLLAHRNL